MAPYTVQQRINIVQIYYENRRSVTITLRKLRPLFGRNNVPSERAIRDLVQKFETSGMLIDKPRVRYQRRGRSDENIARVSDSVREEPTTSIRRRSQQLTLSYGTTQRILTKDLHLKAYKIQLTQELKETDHQKRRTFVNWVLENTEVDADFCKKIVLSDEAHFHLNGFVNRQNCRIWGSENPHVIQEKPMHPQKCTIWCALWAGGIIGPYFFEDEGGNAVTVNGVRYREMLSGFFFNETNDLNLNDMWFQQDGATCHTARETVTLLQTKYPGRVISQRGDIDWPPRSCDLTPLDFFLWGYLKERVYVNKPATIPELKENIRRAIAEIEPHLCESVMKNFAKRMVSCQRSRGGHLADIIFHT